MKSTDLNGSDQTGFITPAITVEYDRAKKEIFIKDLTDKFNEPACVSTSKRGIDAAYVALWQANDCAPAGLTHREAMTLLTANGIRYHYWCMVD
jgi:hypothetical protein